MRSFTGKTAVVTGGGAGMGRELVVQLAAEGCSVAACDVDDAALAAPPSWPPRPHPAVMSGSRPTTATCRTRPR
ncbi:SDR family NAD(P)-dependent oxidoreductase [Nonomuraea thailandensis]